ncbi:MAG: ATP-binding protein, partial [Planctomycetota bacterium]
SGFESELRQALVNLIINAADAMDHGGTLTISTRLVTEPDDMIEIQVSDTGTGMDADTQSRVFEPYFTTKHGKGGTGLGLSSVWGVVQRHGGTILVASESGLGTTFTIRLPAAPDADATEESRSTMAPGPARQLRVLCVDDDPRLRSLVEEMLTLLGHAVTVAGGGDEARQLFDPTLHDLVITDLGMPDVNGQAVAEHVKRTSPPTPVILLTGWGQQILDTDRKPHCVDVVLAKPPSMDKLSSTLARVSRGQVQP